MSVVIREIDNNTYFQVRRKVMTSEGSKQLSKYINITGLSSDSNELKELETEAHLIDDEYAARQKNNGSVINQFYYGGRFYYITLCKPTKKSGWTMKCIIHATDDNAKHLYVSRSVDKHGLAGAFNQCYALLMKHFNIINNTSTSWLKTVWYADLREKYQSTI